MGYTLHVVSHTHWDREWYEPFELFRLRLVDLVDRLLDLMEADPGYRFFNLDGQGIVLEDYLRIRPHNEERLRKLIQEGRITIGPWYVLNDEFLVSGESTVRSLLIGHKVVGQFGPVMKIGYLPDQFGNISQMPQILRNFGIDNCIFGRGYQVVDDRKMEFLWQSPDGSEVLSSLMALWYNNAQDIPEDAKEGEKWTKRLRDAMKDKSAFSHLLFMNGVDHLEAQYNLSKALDNISGELKKDKILHSTLPQYVEGLRTQLQSDSTKLKQLRGELREDRWSSILAGVLSARIYLKQANETCQRLLEKYAEPASVWALLAGAEKSKDREDGFHYPDGELEYAWKLLMENHPHDSICGCSLDEVHDEMMTRFDKVEQLAGVLRDRALRKVADKVDVDGQALVVFNPLTWQRTDVVRTTIDIPLGPNTRFAPAMDKGNDWPALEILDENGQSVPYTLLYTDRVVRNVRHPQRLPEVQWVRRFEVEFIAQDVPAMGYRTFRLQRAEMKPDFGPPLNSMAHDALFAEAGVLDVNPGSAFGYDLAWRDENEAIFLSCLSSLEDVGDVGDEYNYRPPARDTRVLSRAAGERRYLVEGPVSVAMQTRATLRLPEGATPDRKGRSDRMVDCPVSLTARVYRGIPRVEMEFEIDNRAKDHRLRALFPTEAEGAEGSVAGGAYDAIQRPLHVPSEWKTTPPPSPFHPMDGWVDVSNGDQGLAVLVDGLKEYELYADDNRTLGITLLRCVGVLAGGGEIPNEQPTPGAQCQGMQRARYALFPHKGDWKAAKVWKEALNYQAPLQAVQVGDLDRNRTIEKVKKSLPLSHSFVSVSNDALVFSALKRSEDGEGCILRLYNTLEEEVSAEIAIAGAKSVWKSNLAEERLEQMESKKGKLTLTARPKEILTLAFE